MLILDKLSAGFGLKKAPEDAQPASTIVDPESQMALDSIAVNNKEGVTSDVGFPDDAKVLPTVDAQRGVQKMEATTLAWTKKSLAAILILYVSALAV